jgi:hypothetical protein
LYHLQSAGQIEVAYAKPSAKKKRRLDVSVKSFVTPIAIAVAIGILLLEIFAGAIISNRGWLSFGLIQKEAYQKDQKDYQDIFFYKHNRNPSFQEIEGLF